MAFQPQPLECRADIEVDNLPRRLVRSQFEQDRDQALDDVRVGIAAQMQGFRRAGAHVVREPDLRHAAAHLVRLVVFRSEEHTSELQSLMRISYAVFCLKKKTKNSNITNNRTPTSDILTIETS